MTSVRHYCAVNGSPAPSEVITAKAAVLLAEDVKFPETAAWLMMSYYNVQSLPCVVTRQCDVMNHHSDNKSAVFLVLFIPV